MSERVTAWRTGRLGDFINLKRGFDITVAEQHEGDVPVVSSSGIGSYHNKAMVKGPGVVIGRKGKLGEAFYVDRDFWPHDTSLWVTDFKGNDHKFIAYFLRWLRLERLDAATSVPTLNRNSAHQMRVAMPELPEQQRIAEILDSLDEQVRVSEEILVKLRKVRLASIKQVFNMGSWATEPLDSVLADIDAGHSPNLEDTPAGPDQWGVLKVSAVGIDGFHPEENKVVSDRSLCNPAICVRQGDLLMTRANTAQLVGRACIVDENPHGLMLCDKTLRLRVDESIVPTEYIHITLNLDETRRQIENAATGTSGSMKNISQKSIRRLQIPLGGPEDVAKVVQVETLHKAQISALRAQVEQLRLLKRGLMEDLLSGLVRVADPGGRLAATGTQDSVS